MHRDKSRLRQSRPPNLLRSLRNLGSNISIETLAACISPKSRKKRAIKVSFPPSVFRCRYSAVTDFLSRVCPAQSGGRAGCLPLFFLSSSLEKTIAEEDCLSHASRQGVNTNIGENDRVWIQHRVKLEICPRSFAFDRGWRI